MMSKIEALLEAAQYIEVETEEDGRARGMLTFYIITQVHWQLHYEKDLPMRNRRGVIYNEL